VTATAPPSSVLHSECIKRHIRSVPDCSMPTVRLRDSTPLLSNARASTNSRTAVSIRARPRSLAWMRAA
jgi:hypothetical protein